MARVCRAQAILALLRDPERLEKERSDFAARRPALSGFSRDAAPVGLGLSSAATFVSQVAREHRANGGAASAYGEPDDGRAASPDLRWGAPSPLVGSQNSLRAATL